MKKNIEVAEVNVVGNDIYQIVKVIEDEQLPIGLQKKNYYTSEMLVEWSRSRCIPNAIPKYSILRKDMEDTKLYKCMKEMKVSLTDFYWLKSSDSDGEIDKRWEHINFYSNGFENYRGELSKFDDLLAKDGSLSKYWIEKSGTPYLLKNDERYKGILAANEVVYYKIAELAGVETVVYEKNGQYGCECASFISDDNEEFISAMQLEFEDTKRKLNHNILLYMADDLGFAKEIGQMCILDTLMYNTDRHARNFGYIINKKGEKKFAPLFDNGLCLGVNSKTEICDIPMKKFEEYSRKDVLNVFKPTCKLEIDEMKAQNILKKVYEEYKISEERYEVAEKVLKEGFEIIERKRKKTFGKWIPKFLWELLV